MKLSFIATNDRSSTYDTGSKVITISEGTILGVKLLKVVSNYCKKFSLIA